MRQPSEEQLDAFADLGAAVLAVPEIEEGFALYLRPLSLPEFRELANGLVQERQRQNASMQAIMRAALWPSRGEIKAACESFSGLVKRGCETLQELAGKCSSNDPAEEWIRFDAGVSDDELAELGIGLEVAAELRSRFGRPGQLRICRLRHIDAVLVVKRPTLTCANRLAEHVANDGEFFDCVLDASVDCIVYASQGQIVYAADKVADLLRAFPALGPCILFNELIAMSKGEATASAKKLVRRGRQSGS